MLICNEQLLQVKQEKGGICTFSILDIVLIIFYMIKFLVLLDEDFNLDLGKSCISFIFCSKTSDYVYQDIKVHTRNQQGRFIYINKYSDIKRGSYRGTTYIVKPGDTLFYISWISGSNCINLARDNNIQDVSLLKIGQVLKVNSDKRVLCIEKLLKIIFNSVKHSNLMMKKIIFLVKKFYLFIQIQEKNVSYINVPYERNLYLKIPNMILHNVWHWPTYGKVIDTFSDSEGGNKGIDISGEFGQPILAVTNGKVVYVGNVLKGYGNLIIIKHDNDYLSAYAHNDIVLVSEQQNVKIGDKIATMGNSGTNKIKLHFEIKHKGKSVDPLFYLSKNY